MGYIDVEEMLDKIPAWKFERWMMYLQMEPHGEERGDLQAGIVASALVNINKKRGSKASSPMDFMPKFEYVKAPAKVPQSLDEMKSRLLAIHKKFGNAEAPKRQKKHKKKNNEDTAK